MKKLIVLDLVLIMNCIVLFAQTPDYFNYQAVIRNNSGELITNQNVDVRISIIDDIPTGTILYTETHVLTTNNYGVVSLRVGDGTPSVGTFDVINWTVNDKFIKTEINDGSGYVDVGTTQLLSVPYAFYAELADSAKVAGMAYNANALSSNGVYSTNTDTLFVVKDHEGNVVFAVFPDGAQVIVNETTKGKVGGFAVSGRSPNKAVDLDILRITPDSTRIYVNDTVSVKGKVGGFAVSGRSPNKSISTDILYVTADSTRVYVNEEAPVKGKVGGFAVSGRSPNKGTINNYLQVLPDSTRIYVKDSVAGFGIANIESGTSESLLNLTKQNYLIGHNAGANLTTGKYNSMVGYEAGLAAETAYSNLFLGHRSGYSNVSGNDNVFIGNKTGFSVSGGYDNIFIGNMAGEESQSVTHNTFIGNEAGRNVNGDDNICIGDRTGYNQYTTTPELLSTTIVGVDAGRNVTGESNVVIGSGAGASWGGTNLGGSNVFIGVGAGAGAYTSRLGSNNICIGYQAGFGATGDNKLYIDNSNAPTPLIYGDFSADELTINGTLYATTYGASDINLKTNLIEIQSGLEILSAISAYYFNWNDLAKKEFNYSDDQQVGIIAQDAEKVLPQIVVTNSKGYKAVDYSKLSPVIIEAIKEQQTQIEELKSENEMLKQKLNEIIQLLEEK